MKIPVDSIVIPNKYIELCSRWCGGQDCMLYAICSTSGFTIGSIRPRCCDTNEQWYYTIWLELSADVAGARRAAEKVCDDYDADYGFGDFTFEDLQSDCEELRGFENWVDTQCERLCESYGLDEWERE